MPAHRLTRKSLSSLTLAELLRILTPKQRAFAELLARGGKSKRDAYIEAYDVKPGRKLDTVSAEACNASNNPKVEKVTDLLREVYSRPALQSASATRAFVLGVFEEVARQSDDKNRVAAATALGKTIGLFLDRKEVIHRQAGAESDIEAVSRIQALLAQYRAAREDEREAGVIDVSAEQEPDPSVASIDNPELSLLPEVRRYRSEPGPDDPSLDPDL